MTFYKLQRLLPLPALMLLFTAWPANGAEPPVAPSTEIVKKRIDREKTFLLRSSDELNRTQAFVNETIAVLTEQVEAAAGRDSDNNERLALLDWYQRYAEWLQGMSAEVELDVSNYYSRQKAGSEWPARYEELAEGCRKSAGELGGIVRKLDGERQRIETRMQKVNTAVVERRVLVDKDDLELARELWPSYKVSYERREAIYKELTDDEVLRLQNELRRLGEQQKYFECLAELGRYEQAWLNIKAGDFAKLNEIARVLGGDDAVAAASAYRSAIRTYEADAAALTRKSAELDAKLRAVVRTGSLKTLDRLEELSRYYEKMKNRYGRQVEWLKGQIGSCQADLVELGREL